MNPARFQSFDDSTEQAASAARLAALRAELALRGLDGWIVPRADRHQNEYVPPADERLRWLTGFTGSAGVAIVLAERAALFVDGRYALQAREEVDTRLLEIVHLVETPPHKWVETSLPAGAVLGYDPWLHTADAVEKLAAACKSADGTFIPAEPNLIDAIWTDRPAEPLGPIVLHDQRYAGESAVDKLARVRAELRKLKSGALVVSDPTSLAWAFNVRGSDVAHTPLPLAFAIIPVEDHPSLYADPRKLSNAVDQKLEELAEIKPPGAFVRDLIGLAHAGVTFRLDQATAAQAIVKAIESTGGTSVRGTDPIAAMKTIKNATEIDGARATHRRDGAALACFLAWLDREAPKGSVSEIAAVEALEDFRRATGLLKDISFPTIAGAGPNGAIVHYRVTRKSNRRLAAGELFLIDSGGQYEDGTTDVTRTVAVGPPSEEMRERFTRVLKGHIAIARAVFPEGTTGAQLDSFARASLWSAGLDFDHGTGHGVGSYLSVHEGPPRISKLGTVALERGMILSNEPGYYKAGAYGIRTENLVFVVEAQAVAGAEKPLNTFETLTLAPIDRRLILPSLMTQEEIAWLDTYHARVRTTISPLVDDQTKMWLEEMTRPLL
jgi:Xaa-Pro aminopeptidase